MYVGVCVGAHVYVHVHACVREGHRRKKFI
jgi:hypothetical protein